MLSACNKKNYTISFEENGGSIVTDIKTKNGNQISQPTNPTKNGYSFDGWFLSKDFSGTQYIFGKMPKGNKTLYAKWDLISYNISYELNDGINNSSNPVTYTIETDTITLQNPTKTGFVFAGWTGSNGTTPETELTFPDGTIGDLTFTANWTISKHNVSFVVNNSSYGSVDITSLSNINFNTAISANSNVLTIGTNTITATPTTATAEYIYNFDKWQIKYNTDYADLTATDKVTSNLEIKAIFSRETHKYGVCWINGESVLQDGDVNYNATSSYIGNTPRKDSTHEYTYRFIGWSTDKNATTPAFTTNTTGNITSDTTYYAIYEQSDRTYPADILISSDGDDVFGTIFNYASSSYTYGPGGNQGATVNIKYGAHIESKVENALEISDAPKFVARAKESTGNYEYTFLYWQIVSNGQTINLPYDSENTINNCLPTNYAIITSIKAVFERNAIVKESNGELALKIDGENVNGPYTYAGETYTLSATGNKGTAQNTFTVVNGTGEATISGNILTVTKAGTLTIKVNNAGDGNYLPATETSNEITINKGNPGLSYATTIIEKHVGDIFTNTLTNPYNLAVTYSKNSPFEDYNLNTVTGEVTITKISVNFSVKASISENDLWNSQFVSYAVKVVPKIELRVKNGDSFVYNTYEDYKPNDEIEEYEGATFTLTTNCAISLNNVVFSIVSGGTGEATISESILTLTKAGTVIIRVAADAEGYVSPYSHDFTITFNKGIFGAWNEDIQIGGESLYDYDEDAFITTQSTNFTAIACIYDTTTQIPATYSSSNTNVATVNATTGEVTILGEAGQTVNITATINFANDNLWEDLTNYTITYILTIGE